jgi:uncharacterized protein YjhX (UPF0386 family)
MTALTGPQRRALETIARVGAITSAKQFARLMWPDSDGWTTLVGHGHGVARGGQMPSTAGSFLSRLVRKGWVTGIGGDHPYRLTAAGIAALDADRSNTP